MTITFHDNKEGAFEIELIFQNPITANSHTKRDFEHNFKQLPESQKTKWQPGISEK